MKIYAQGTILAYLPFKIPLKPQTLSKPEKNSKTSVFNNSSEICWTNEARKLVVEVLSSHLVFLGCSSVNYLTNSMSAESLIFNGRPY